MSDTPDFSRIETYSDSALLDVQDLRVISDVQASISNAINDYREIVSCQGIWLMGHFWDSSETARSNLNGATTIVLAGIPLPAGFVWRDNANINVPFNTQQLVMLGAMIVNFVNLVYNFSWELKAQVDAMTTLEDLDAFVIEDQAWPDGNMDGSMPVTLPNSFSTSWVGMPYTANVVVHGGKAPYTLSLSDGSLPDGLVLANNALTGTPTTAETYTFTLTATDSTANTAMTGSQSYTFTVLPGN